MVQRVKKFQRGRQLPPLPPYFPRLWPEVESSNPRFFMDVILWKHFLRFSRKRQHKYALYIFFSFEGLG